MEVSVPSCYLGRDINGKPVIDWSKSGKYVLGIYANIQAICICVIKIYDNKSRWYIKEEFYTNEIEINKCLDKCDEFIERYDIQHIFGNNMASSICKIKNSYSASNESKQTRGFEKVELQPEHLMFLVQGQLEKTKIDNDIKKQWDDEIDNFDIDELRNNRITYARVFALASVMQSAEPNTPFIWSNVDIPDTIIDSETGKIITKEDIKSVEVTGYKIYKDSNQHF